MNRVQSRYTPSRFFLLLAVALVLPACEKAPEPEVQDVVRPIKMMTLGGGGAGSTLEYPGTVSATRSVEMGFEVPGKIIEVNEPLLDAPEMINEDPYDEGWMVKVELSDSSELDELMDAAGYEACIKEESK